MKKLKIFSLMLVVSIVISAWNFPGDPKKNNKSAGVDTSYMDLSFDPREDFYQYSCGNWLKHNPVPGSESSWGSFNEIQERNNDLLKEILEEAASKKSEPGSIRQIIGDFYYAAMDTLRIEEQGIKPLNREFKLIKEIKTLDDVIKITADFHLMGISTLFSFYVYQDAKSSSENIIYIGQGGLGLPDRDYYLKEDSKSKNTLAEYNRHIEQMFLLVGKSEKEAQQQAKIVLDIETKMATYSSTKVELRNIEKQYNKKTIVELNQIAKHINWNLYFKELNISGFDRLIVSQPEFIKGLDSLFLNTSVDQWRVYLEWHLIRETAGKLNSKIAYQNFYFYNTVLNGVKQMKPRWKNALNTINELLGEALGQAFVEKAFSSDSKKRINEYVDNITEAFKERISSLDWMSDSTKIKALQKLNSFSRKIGYPDRWKDYSKLEVNRESYVRNYLSAQAFEVKLNLEKLSKPVDRTEWAMPPQKVNAYYNPLLNEIVFPAAILQPPFFDPNADDAINYGGIGAVIGHELTHGFDDQGCKFSGNGNIENWWTESDEKKFKEKTKILVRQFDSYPALDSLNVNGELTLGENIADLGGLSIAYYAYQKSLKGKNRELIDGYTPEQRFFISWGQIWKNNMRPQALRQMILTNPHSPGKYRVYGPLVNMSEFYEAFGVSKGNKMYLEPQERAKIW